MGETHWALNDFADEGVIGTPGEPGKCEDCAAFEIPYNGNDDDCNPATEDGDVDRDGDNAATTLFRPGTDCDDNDPEVFGGPNAREICDDQKDNNCNGTVDEPECSDFEDPFIRFTAPAPDSEVSGRIVLQGLARDDAGLEQVTVRLQDPDLPLPLDDPLTGAPAEFQINSTFDTAQLADDGLYTFQARAVDVAGRTSEATLTLRVDNRTGPKIDIESPRPGSSVSGMYEIRVTASDVSGIREIRAEVNGEQLSSSSSPLVAMPTARQTEGERVLTVIATDGRGNSSTTSARFNVDNSPPAIRILQPRENDQLLSPFDVVIEASDASGVDIEFMGEEFTSTSTSVTETFETRLAPGRYTLTATITDNTQVDLMRSRTATASVTVDVITRDPQITFIFPREGDPVFGKVDIEVDVASPAGETIEEVIISVNDQALSAEDTVTTRVAYDFTLLDEDSALLQVTATDAQSRTSTRTMTIDILPGPRFSVAATTPSVAGATAFDLGDLDGDGIIDAVLTGPHTDLQWMKGAISPSGDWQLAPPEVLKVGNQTIRADEVRIGQVDDRRPLDIVVQDGNMLRALVNPGPNPGQNDPWMSTSVPNSSDRF